MSTKDDPRGLLRPFVGPAPSASPQGVRLLRAQDGELLARILDLRREVYRREGAYLLRAGPGKHPAEDEHDARSHHFAALVGERAVAACRFTPCPAGRWELCDEVALPAELERDCAGLLQIARVVVLEEERRHHLSEALIAFACRWLADHTPLRGYFALCTPVHVRYYRHFGARAVEGPLVSVPGRAGQRYRFIRGDLVATAETTARFLAAHARPAPAEHVLAPAPRPADESLAGAGS